MANKHVVFLIHGMGDFKKNWSKKAQKIIRDSFDSYPMLGWIPFEDQFQFKEIVYNNEFEEIRDLWKSQNKALKIVLEAQGIGGAISTLNSIASLPDKDSFLTTHVLDVLLYRFMPQIGAAVRDSVRSQILNALSSLDSAQPVRWSIIAHSLGTSVTHDSLHELYTDQQTVADNPLLQVTRPQSLAMIANVSRVLETFKDVYTSVVTPGAPEDTHVCKYYLNAHHAWDPFPKPKQFKPKDDWPSLAVRAQEPLRFNDIEIRTIEKVNVHGFEHYLRNPKVHIPLFHSLVDNEAVDSESSKNAHLKFVAKSPREKFGEFVSELDKFSLSDTDSWKKISRTWREFMENFAND